jgi:hypothetical protein
MITPIIAAVLNFMVTPILNFVSINLLEVNAD